MSHTMESRIWSCSHVSVKHITLHSRHSCQVLVRDWSPTKNLTLPVMNVGKSGLNLFTLSLCSCFASTTSPWYICHLFSQTVNVPSRNLLISTGCPVFFPFSSMTGINILQYSVTEPVFISGTITKNNSCLILIAFRLAFSARLHILYWMFDCWQITHCQVWMRNQRQRHEPKVWDSINRLAETGLNHIENSFFLTFLRITGCSGRLCFKAQTKSHSVWNTESL